LLDVDLLEYAINKDKMIRHSEKKNLVITCLDHIEKHYRFTRHGKLIDSESKEEFIIKISNILNIKNVYYSKSPYSNKLIKIF